MEVMLRTVYSQARQLSRTVVRKRRNWRLCWASTAYGSVTWRPTNLLRGSDRASQACITLML